MSSNQPAGMSMSTCLSILLGDNNTIRASTYAVLPNFYPVIEIMRRDYWDVLFSWDNSPMTEAKATAYAQSCIDSIRGKVVEP